MSDVINGVPRSLLERVNNHLHSTGDFDPTYPPGSHAVNESARLYLELRALLTAQPQASAALDASAERNSMQRQRDSATKALARESDDADAILRLAGLNPAMCRTDSGFLNLPRIETLLAEKARAAQSAPAGEREAFQEAATGFSLPLDESTHRGTFYEDDRTFWMHRGWQAGAAWQRTQSAGGPEGYALVPIDPTPKMLVAYMGTDGAVKRWKAMVAAAKTEGAHV